jgi:hypothetical protein
MKFCTIFLIVVASTLACENNFDCSLGGHCNKDTGECNCSNEWTGEDCSKLALLPAEIDNGFQPVNSTTWGGKILVGSSGEYHLYAAKMAGNCGLHSWRDNSEVVHAVSVGKPTGPYYEVETTIKTFSHNPTAENVKAASPEAQYIMWNIGCGIETTNIEQCENGTTPDSIHHFIPESIFIDSKGPEYKNGNCDNPHWVGMQTSPSPEGPWTSVTSANKSVIIQNPNPGEESWHTKPEFTNPSIWPLEDGVIVMAYATSCPKCEQGAGNKHIGIAIAETWEGPYIDVTPKEPIFPFASEDPVIFVSPKLGAYHLIAHSHDAAGAVHAFATQPEGPWTISETPPYTEEIEWADGTHINVQKRERPQIIFIGGVPALLVNGVEPRSVPTPWTPDGYTGDWSYTHVQAIRT